MNKLLSPSRLAWLTCALCLASWLAAPSASAQTGNAATRQADFIVAVVNSEPITNNDVQVMRDRLRVQSAAQTNPPDNSTLSQLALERLINEKAQMQQAKEFGIKIDDEAIAQAELNIASNNQLTLDVLHERLKQDGIDLTTFREQLRTQLTLSRLREREVDNRVRLGEQEVEAFLREQLKAQALQVPPQLNLGMVLIAVPENSTAQQVQVLAARAAEVSKRARGGESFAELAKVFSQASDRGANGGVMGLRPADRYPDLFLNATRDLKEGDVSEPVRSAAGFHILKLIERVQVNRLLVTQTRARHILLRPSVQLSQAQAIARLNAVRQDVVSGKADFAALAQELSQDGSAKQGGDLGWANPGMFVPEFEQVMNSLRPGQLAEPLVSRFGVHLIEVLERRNAPMSDEEQRTLARNALRAQKADEAYATWAQDVRGRAYVELREPPQ